MLQCKYEITWIIYMNHNNNKQYEFYTITITTNE